MQALCVLSGVFWAHCGWRKEAFGTREIIIHYNWLLSKNINELRSFLGFTNYYASYVDHYAETVAILQGKLKVPRELGKRGSKVPITWTDADQKAFEEIKEKLCSGLSLTRVDPDRPYILRTDASNFAIGAVLEQFPDEKRLPTGEQLLAGKTVPVAFLSRKLAEGQVKWVPREKETYAIIAALEKWHQPVLVWTDHTSLKEWTNEVLDPPPVVRWSAV